MGDFGVMQGAWTKNLEGFAGHERIIIMTLRGAA